MNMREQTLGQLVLDIDGAAAVMRRYRLDYCCGGQQTLAEAAAQLGVDVAELEAELLALSHTETRQDWTQAPLPALIDFIVQRYHQRHRQQLPCLIDDALKVERVHAAKADVPAGLASLLQALNAELDMHMMKEERVLFPMIQNGMGRNAAAPIAVMEREHDEAGELVAKILTLTDNLTPPEAACTTWRALYQGVDGLIGDLMDHIHLENQVLFPRALAEA